MAITNVNGIFKTFEGSVACPSKGFDDAAVIISIAADSIDTQLPPRDAHLKSAYLFDTELYPLIKFEGTLKNDGEAYALNGGLTIRDVTRTIKLDAKFTGSARGFAGDDRAGFEVYGLMSRKDFGLSWNIEANGGGLIIGDEIKLHFDIQLVKRCSL